MKKERGGSRSEKTEVQSWKLSKKELSSICKKSKIFAVVVKSLKKNFSNINLEMQEDVTNTGKQTDKGNQR